MLVRSSPALKTFSPLLLQPIREQSSFLLISQPIRSENFKYSKFQPMRALSTKTLTPTISLLSSSSGVKEYKRGKNGSYSSEGRPLSILLCWLMAKNRAVNKYAEFYIERGFDVLTVRISPAQLLFPAASNLIVERELMPILSELDHSKSLVHGFSVGGYVFGQMLRVARENPKDYDKILQKMVGQIWDSVVDVNGTSIGVSKSVFPKSPLFQKTLQDSIDLYMKLMHNISTKHYYISHEYFYNHPLKSPALFLNSAQDQISTLDVIQAVIKIWEESHNVATKIKMWPNTPHVGHMQRHPEEYKKTLEDFLKEIGLKSNKGRLVDEKKTPIYGGEYNVVG